MLKKKIPAKLLVGVMALTGLVAGIATMAGAQSITTHSSSSVTPVVTTSVVDTPEPGDTLDGVQSTSAVVDTPEVGDVPDSMQSATDQKGESLDTAGDHDGDSASEMNEAPDSSEQAD